jgi:hypothetical protein
VAALISFAMLLDRAQKAGFSLSQPQPAPAT